MAKNNQAKVINLCRLQKVFLGKLTFDSIKQLEKQTKVSFKGNAYKVASHMTNMMLDLA